MKSFAKELTAGAANFLGIIQTVYEVCGHRSTVHVRNGGDVERCEKWWWVWRDVRSGGGCGEM